MVRYIDTGFWIARLSRDDQWHEQAVRASKLFKPSDRFVTSDYVIVELLNFFSTAGSFQRSNAVALVEAIEGNSDYDILPITRPLFRESLALYERNADKAWSLTDCSSILLMEELDITHALTFDRHFEQAGFITLRQ